MGAEAFQTSAKADSFREAVDKATADALYWYGHGGYTGTIAEKDGAVEYTIPWEKLGVDESSHPQFAIDMVQAACNGYHNWATETEKGLASLFSEVMGESKFAEMASLHDDKWGSAVGFKLPNGEYGFCGWAST